MSSHSKAQKELTQPNSEHISQFSTGAFVGLVNLSVGENKITVQASIQAGTTQLTREVERTAPLVTTLSSVLAIETALMLPNVNLEMQAGDMLLVQFKGNLGGKASFSVGGSIQSIPMTEKPTSCDSELRGIYTGIYRIRPEDRVTNWPVQFHLEVPHWAYKRASEARLTVQPELYPQRAITKDAESFLAVGTGQAGLGAPRARTSLL